MATTTPPPGAPAPSQHAFVAPAGAPGQRLDQALALLLPQHSRTRLKGWIEAGQVIVDGKPILEPKFRIRGGMKEAFGVDPETGKRRGLRTALALVGKHTPVHQIE